MKRPPSRLTAPALRLIVRTYLRRLGQEERADRVRVRFNPRMRSAIGRCEPARNTIYLNPRLIDRHPRELIPTLVHELCHLIAGYRAGHGPQWRDLMTRLGFRPDLYHDLDVSEVRMSRRTWRWLCRKCGEKYFRKTRAAHRYRCGSCGGRLELGGEAQRAARGARPPKKAKGRRGRGRSRS